MLDVPGFAFGAGVHQGDAVEHGFERFPDFEKRGESHAGFFGGYVAGHCRVRLPDAGLGIGVDLIGHCAADFLIHIEQLLGHHGPGENGRRVSGQDDEAVIFDGDGFPGRSHRSQGGDEGFGLCRVVENGGGDVGREAGVALVFREFDLAGGVFFREQIPAGDDAGRVFVSYIQYDSIWHGLDLLTGGAITCGGL